MVYTKIQLTESEKNKFNNKFTNFGKSTTPFNQFKGNGFYLLKKWCEICHKNEYEICYLEKEDNDILYSGSVRISEEKAKQLTTFCSPSIKIKIKSVKDKSYCSYKKKASIKKQSNKRIRQQNKDVACDLRIEIELNNFSSRF